jgi:amphi-Trp domain-containing protein
MSKTKDKTGEFEYESLQDTDSIVAYLETIAAGFRTGRLLFCWGDQEMVLRPGGLLDFEVKARSKDGRVKVDLQISWKERDEQTVQQPLLIQAKEE